jgi:DNA invertase Pin-like site-specific DNA recombinase
VQYFVEVESGKRNDRPELAAALAACKKHKAKLIIAKLDRTNRLRPPASTVLIGYDRQRPRY